MIGKIVSALAGRSLARSLGGAAAGPAGAVIGAAAPVVVSHMARRMSPLRMVALAAGGIALVRYVGRHRRADSVSSEGAPRPS